MNALSSNGGDMSDWAYVGVSVMSGLVVIAIWRLALHLMTRSK